MKPLFSFLLTRHAWHWLGNAAADKNGKEIRKFKENDWGETKSPPPMAAPKVKKAPEPEAEASEEAPAEEAAAEEEKAE